MKIKKLELIVRNSSNELVKQIESTPNSLLKNFVFLIYSMTCPEDLSVIDINGSNKTIKNTYNYRTSWGLRAHFFYSNAEAGSAWGVVIGDSNTPVTKDDYQLGNLLSVMQIQVHRFSSSIGSNSVDWEIKRAFTNLTGSDVIVREIGHYIKYYDFYIMIVRDVISDLTIPSGGSLTIKYTYSHEY